MEKAKNIAPRRRKIKSLVATWPIPFMARVPDQNTPIYNLVVHKLRFDPQDSQFYKLD